MPDPLDQYDPIIQQAAQEWNVDPTLLKAIGGVESRGNPRAVSPAGAQGLMQLTPPTQKALGVDNPFDPVQSIYGAAKYMSQALDAEKTPEDALRYYNGGPNWRNNPAFSQQGGNPVITSANAAGHTFNVNQDYAPNFTGFLNELAATGYKINDVQGYNNRTIAGSQIMSHHASGAAIDVNPSDNPVNGKHNLPPNIGDIAAKWGLGWGGAWTGGKTDPMHFSIAKEEGGAFDIPHLAPGRTAVFAKPGQTPPPANTYVDTVGARYRQLAKAAAPQPQPEQSQPAPVIALATPQAQQ